ncbi:MAG TPA: hypothetical protein VIW78_02950 [Burkholderiales bacterium]
MDTLIVMFQTLCVAGLALGSALSFYQMSLRASRQTQRFTYAAANDFETGFRRLMRARR